MIAYLLSLFGIHFDTDSIIKDFNKTVSKLEGHAKKQRNRGAKKSELADSLNFQAGAHYGDAARADAVAAKINSLLTPSS